MNVAVKWGVILAVVIAVISMLIAVTGMHKTPIAALVFIVVAIVVNVVAVFMALKQTAAENSYGRQLLAGVVLGAVAGVLIFLSSWLMLSAIFPDYLAESQEGTIAFMESVGATEEQIDTQIEKFEQATPVNQSLSGLIGTFFTSLIAAAIVAIFKRKK